jgi:hypothetical protein
MEVARWLPSDAQWQQAVLLAVIANGKDPEREAALRAMGVPGNGWAVAPIIEAMRSAVAKHRRGVIWSGATALGEIGDARVIPDLIELIAADNSYDTVYGIGYFALNKLTGVDYQETHDGAWWQNWWRNNSRRFAGPASVPTPQMEADHAEAQDQARPVTAPTSRVTSPQQESPVEWLTAGGIDRAVIDKPGSPFLEVMIYEIRPDNTAWGRYVERSEREVHGPVWAELFPEHAHVVDVAGQDVSLMRTDTTAAMKTAIFPIRDDGVLVYGAERTYRGDWVPEGDQGVRAYAQDIRPDPDRGPTRCVQVHRFPVGARVLWISANATKRQRGGIEEVVLDQIIPKGGSVKLAYRYQLAEGKQR